MLRRRVLSRLGGAAAGRRRASTLSHAAYDVVVVGGGMVGAAVACRLAREPLTRGLRVALLEGGSPAPLRQLPAAPGLRVSAVSHASRRVLERAGAWERVLARRASPYDEMQVWDAAGGARVHWRAGELLGQASLGHVVENDVVQASLFEAALEAAGERGCNLEVVAPARVAAIEAPAGGAGLARVRLESGDEVEARLVVGADGPASQVKRHCGLGSWGWSYDQMGVVAAFRTAEPHRTAWQRFLPWGPLALLPAHGDYSSMVWTTTPAHARRLCDPAQMPPGAVLRAVNDAFRLPAEDFCAGGELSWWHRPLPEELREVLPVLAPPPPRAVPPEVVELVEGGPRSFPLRLQHCSTYVRPRVALVGDAAHVVHPLAGQGVNLGFADADALASAVAGAVEAGEDVGSEAALAGYAAGRTRDNAAVIAGVDTIQRAFSARDGPVALARTAAMALFDASPTLKRQAARMSGAAEGE